MDRETLYSLMKDLKRAKHSLVYLRRHPERNFGLAQPGEDYLNPPLEEGTPEDPRDALYLGHKDGAFMYIVQMMEIIKKALAGRLSQCELPANAPGHLERACF